MPSAAIIFVVAVLLAIPAYLLGHLQSSPESADAFGNAVGDFVADHIVPNYVPDAIGDAIGDVIGDVVADFLDADDEEDESSSRCSLSDEDFATDPAIQTMVFDLGYGPQEFHAYVQPDVSTFYLDEPGTREQAKPRHEGIAAKFVNISTRNTRLFWCPGNGGRCSPMSHMRPFESAGTASFPRHVFHIEDDDTGEVLARFAIDPPTSVYYYDAITVENDPEATARNMEQLAEHELEAYRVHMDSRKFGDEYFRFTGRPYLSMYPRNAPSHKMWPANYFGQEHWVTTRETHFVTNPPLSELGSIDVEGSARKLKAGGEPRLLFEYREEEAYLNMTLKVLSCAPRAFEINDFLSQVEVDHIMYLTTGLSLHRSTTAGGAERDEERDHTKDTRTSLNTWVYREKDAIMDTIYRRAADLLRIDEALLRTRSTDEYPHMDNSRSLAEALQLVHYSIGQEYTAHHDFGYAKFHEKNQPARFATLLLYLNEPEEGGQTQFPRWVNAETSEGLNVEPRRGKAVLFYSQLPDGNMDDFSHHAALPVRVGEKWLMNLWVWDPIYG